MKTLLVSMVLLFVLMVGCTIPNGETAGSEIGNPTLAAVVMDSSDQPVVGAKVALYEEGGVSPYATTQTNDTGYFEILNLEPGDYSLEVLQSDSSHLMYVNGVSHDTVMGVVRLSRSARLSGVISVDSAFVYVRLSGTHYVAQVMDDGTFLFPYVPSGVYDLLGGKNNDSTHELFVLSEVELVPAGDSHVVYGDTQSSAEENSSSSSLDVVSSVVEGMSSSVQSSSYAFVKGGSLVLDDFEDRNSYNALQPKLGWGDWTVFDDAPEGGGSTVTPKNSTSDAFIAAIKDGSGSEGSYGLLVSYVLDWVSIVEPRVGVAVDIGRGAYDLTSLTSIVFDLRGDAKVLIEFERDVLIDGVIRPLRAGWTTYALEDWSSIALESGDIELNTYYHPEGYGVVQLMPYVYRIRFTALAGTEFALDNIRLNGISLQ